MHLQGVSCGCVTCDLIRCHGPPVATKQLHTSHLGWAVSACDPLMHMPMTDFRFWPLRGDICCLGSRPAWFCLDVDLTPCCFVAAL